MVSPNAARDYSIPKCLASFIEVQHDGRSKVFAFLAALRALWFVVPAVNRVNTRVCDGGRGLWVLGCGVNFSVRFSILVLRRDSPNSLSGSFRFQVVVKLTVVFEQGFEELFLGPKTHLEETRGKFLLDVAFESTPRDEQAFFRAKLLYRAKKLVYSGAADRCVLRFNFNTQPRLTKP